MDRQLIELKNELANQIAAVSRDTRTNLETLDAKLEATYIWLLTALSEVPNLDRLEQTAARYQQQVEKSHASWSPTRKKAFADAGANFSRTIDQVRQARSRGA
jgi:hypothetical protein